MPGVRGSPASIAALLLPALALGAGPAAGSGRREPPGREPGDYRVAQWTTAQGLPQNTVTDIAFLPDGELWLATFGGLARFDGHDFHVIDMASDEGLPANRIVALAPTGDDAFLFLTQQGHLGRVEAGRAALLVPPPLGSVEVLDFLVDRSGVAYARATDGRAWRTDGRNPWEPVPGCGPGDGAHLQAFALDTHGVAWGIRGGRLMSLSGGGPEWSVSRPGEAAVLKPRPGGGFWIGLGRAVARLADDRIERLEVRPALDGEVTAIEPAGEGELWVAGGKEVSRLERQVDGSWRRSALPVRLPPALSVPALRLDREGSLWIGSAAGGLFRVNRAPTRRFGEASGLSGVAAVAPDGEGGAFVASGCRALYGVDRSGVGRRVRLPDPPPGGPVPPCGISLAPGPGTTWVRTGSNVLRLAGLDARLVSGDLPFEEGPIVPAPNGRLFVLSRSGRIHLLSGQGRVLRQLELPAPLMSATRGPDGSLWVGGDGEVFHVGADGVERFGADARVPRGLVRDILAEPDGTTWIGTYGGGVGRLRAGRVARLTAREGLPDNSVSRILDDGRGRLWISTNRGIAVAAKAHLEAVADGHARATSLVVLGMERGVPEANFGSPAGFADAEGRLWFGTIDGVVRIDSAAFPFAKKPPVVRVEQVRADDRVLPLGPEVRVPPLTARLRVSYAAMSLLYPEQMRFRFRVEGVDSEWVDAGNERSVDWTPPGPGRYRFLVDARNEDGIWSSAPAAVVLDVRAEWWQTTLAQLAAGVAVALFAVAFVRQRIRGIERRHAAKLRALEEQRETEEKLSSLRQQLERVSRAALAGELAASLAHEVRQPIGAIVNNAEAGRRNLPTYLERPAELEHIFRDIVADGLRASEIVQGLRGFLGSGGPGAEVDLSALVREMLPLVRRELHDNRVAVDLELADDLPPVDGVRVQLGQVVVNLVVNACEALSAREGARLVVIGTAVREGRVELTVRDNGPGLDPSIAGHVFDPFVTTKPDGLGMGLAICRTIAERHGGHLAAVAAPDGGLVVTLGLPASAPREPRP
jgi:signal transduction histidine kinase/ligand-binding sensor domain-containing protein